MSIATPPAGAKDHSDAASRSARLANSWIRQTLAFFASLKLTVALFLAAIFIILVGTLAQVNADIWEVISEYFRVDFNRLFSPEFPWVHLGELFVWVNPAIFFPPAFFPPDPVFPTGMAWLKPIWPAGVPDFGGFAIPAPKGWLIGALMMVNLFAAHLVRFKVQAQGARLATGLGVIAVGVLLTTGVILSGSNPDGLQSKPLIGYDTLWWLMQTSLFGLCGVCIYACAATERSDRSRRWLFGVLAAILAVSAVSALRTEASSEATMRILYQLIKATFAGLVLLAGCIAVFKKRAGIVLLHAGIGLMMAYDVLVGVNHIESQMHIIEGEQVNFSRDMRDVELAVIDHVSDKTDNVIAIDGWRLKQPGGVIADARLPFKVEIINFYGNSRFRGPRELDQDGKPFENPATAGVGKQVIAQQVAGATGTDTTGGIDVPSAYVRLTTPAGEDLGTYLLSAHFDLPEDAQSVTVDGKTYDIALRFRRLYNDYAVTLNDVQKNDYKGTDRPKDYSSYITLNDPARNTTFDHRIWMNNPMRYGGKTFYQSSYARLEEGEMTTLQVVDNVGWMVPYVACMMVVVGMMYHFGLTLLRFLNRRLKDMTALDDGPRFEGDEDATVRREAGKSSLNRASWIVTGTIVALVALSLVSVFRPRAEKADQPHLSSFGKLPMWYKGRAMPIDTFARNSLMQLSDRQTFSDADGKSQPAIRWLIDMMSDLDRARNHQVIRIESSDVRDAIGLEKREKFTYSLKELNEKIDKVIEQATAASRTLPDQRTLVQRKTIELANRLVFYGFLERTLGRAPELPGDGEIDREDVAKVAARADEFLRFIRYARQQIQEYTEQFGMGPLPLVVPTHLSAGERPPIEELHSQWECPTIGDVYRQFFASFPTRTPPAVDGFFQMIDAYEQNDVPKFNAAVVAYQQLLDKHASAEDVPVAKVNFESEYNRISAFNLASWLYVFAFVLAVTGWLFWPQVFERSAFWLIVLIFLVHTAALVGRIYISGRPPVTNLYSSAVFIGWAAVLGGLVLEAVSRLGIGNVVAATAGFLTLRIAHGLAADGDTFVVLEAVLDTQFWLATHVVCITLGYAATYLAGLMGLFYLVLGIFTRRLTPRFSKEIARMTYGTLCFATFFSFWGTVLGGLWADDSWGRFWGWDPKENGALIIVLWNALVLHARWGGMVKDRGIAILAVLGNIVVSWSWFGVNELGVGLHSYGFTEGRLMMLALFVMSQLLIATIGLVPKSLWRSANTG